MDGDGVPILSLLLAELLASAGIKKIKIKRPLHPHPIFLTSKYSSMKLLNISYLECLFH